jgi:hypothetical protein
LNASPSATKATAARRALKYLKGTSDYALQYKSTGGLIGFSDSDWAGDLNDRKSTAGFTYTLGGAAISWKSKKQKSVALSTLEAEYMASSEAAKEAVWLRSLMEDLKLTTCDNPTIINIHNEGCINSLKNPRYHERTKHIDIRYHFTRNLVEDRVIQVDYIPTAENTADLLTKGLPRETHEKHVRGLGLLRCSGSG